MTGVLVSSNAREPGEEPHPDTLAGVSSYGTEGVSGCGSPGSIASRTMTENCDLCGRGTAVRALAPTWYPHRTVCDRAGCRAAAHDAVVSTLQYRQRNAELVASITARQDGKWVNAPTPAGWRSDTMAKIDVVDGEDWWANDVVKRVR